MSEDANSEVVEINDGNDIVRTHWRHVGNQKPLVEVALEHMIMNGCEECDAEGLDENVLKYLYMLRKNYRIVITSTREKSQRNTIMEWLKMHKVPFDELRLGLPKAMFRLGPRNIEHREWPETIRRIASREEGGVHGVCPSCGSLLVGTYTSKFKGDKKQIKYCRECDWEEGKNVRDKKGSKDKGAREGEQDSQEKDKEVEEHKDTKGAGRSGDSGGVNGKGQSVSHHKDKEGKQ